ncbi:MAG: SGNH/GDSL hydrolase family protein [Lachnospiraceae bacterium]|nr:SGNH/GDSL hydrolase family protein [Lachnospiraceae bacterium]
MIKIDKILLCGLLSACVWIGGCASQESDKEKETQEPYEESANASGQTLQQNEAEEPEGMTGQSNSEKDDSDMLPQKTFSIMGDSISTFDEWIPEGYYDFYPMNGEVAYVNQTWWKMVMNDMGMELCVNASSAGSTCIGDSTGMDNPQHGCSDFRIADLMGNDGTYPDIIIVYMGTNDFLNAVPLGSNDGTQYVEEGEIDDFSDAYSLMLDKLAAYYPGTDIFCCNLPLIGDWGTERLFEIMVNGEGLTSEDYNKEIEVIAAAKGCPIIDLQNCGITIDNMDQYVSDGVHFKPDGMKLIRDAVETAITGFYQ